MKLLIEVRAGAVAAVAGVPDGVADWSCASRNAAAAAPPPPATWLVITRTIEWIWRDVAGRRGVR